MDDPDIQRYEVFYTKLAQKGLSKLDHENKRRVLTKIEEEFLKDPLLYAESLSVQIYRKNGSYKWRVGKIRILFNIEGNKLIVQKVAFRKGVYS